MPIRPPARTPMERQKKDIQRQLRAALVSRGVTQTAFAAQIGIHKTNLSYALHSCRVKTDTLDELSRRLGYRIRLTLEPLDQEEGA